MIHNLTIGHLDIRAIDERRSVVLKPLDEAAVDRHLKALGHHEREGWTLDGMPVEQKEGYLVCRWLVGPRRNLVAEEFALRLQRDTGCEIVDREHYRLIEPGQLDGLSSVVARKPFFAGTRRFLKAMGM
jgi:hypothetical protein